MNSTQLTYTKNYNVNRMVFSAPLLCTVPNSQSKISITYKRINVSTKNEDGSIGDLVLATDKLFSFGVSENKSETGQVTGYSLPLCLWNKDGPSDSEKQWTDTFNQIVEHCKKHLLENRNDIEMYDLEVSDLKKFNPLYWKKEKNVVVPNTGPTLYTKLIVSKKEDKILSTFYDSDTGEELDAMHLMGKYCFVNAAVKIESIYIGGTKIALQVKLWEADVSLVEKGMKRLLRAARPIAATTAPAIIVENDADMFTSDEESDIESGEHDVEEVRAVSPPRKAPIRRRVK